jgi:glucuronate isomerase
MTEDIWNMTEDRFFDPEPSQLKVARELYKDIAQAPIVSPHGHVDPHLFVDENASFGTPADLLIIPDHYVYRMLFSHGVPLEALGVPRLDGKPVENDHRKIWQIFADHFYLFRGTPTGVWLAHELHIVLGICEKLTPQNAQSIYDQIVEKLNSPDFRPRNLFVRFNIEVLCTTDPAWDRLQDHRALRASGWSGDVRPTFRPDDVVNLNTASWRQNIQSLSEASQINVISYETFIQALEIQRTYFKSMGATASDHAVLTPHASELTVREADVIFQRALRGEFQAGDTERFTAHMLMEMARMSIEDGLVMQVHPGSLRDHNDQIYQRFGRDRGGDIPLPTEYTRNLRQLLNRYGNDPRLTLILFTLDETTYSRELAPLAGLYPAVKLGPPWWFFDSLNGMRRYFDQVMETAGIYSTVGFNDDTRAFLSIPARHDLWRRASADWLAGLVVRGLIDEEDAAEMIGDMAYGLAKRAYRLGAIEDEYKAYP